MFYKNQNEPLNEHFGWLLAEKRFITRISFQQFKGGANFMRVNHGGENRNLTLLIAKINKLTSIWHLEVLFKLKNKPLSDIYYKVFVENDLQRFTL